MNKPIALALDSSVTIDEWRTLGQDLAARQRNITWLAGDWFNYGKQHFGEQAVLDLPEFGESIKRLREVARVAERFAPDERDPDLAFAHYRHLVDLPHGEARKLLDKARAERLAPSVLRIEILKAKVELGQGALIDDDPEHQELVRIQRAWNQASRSTRGTFLDLATESNLEPIDG